MAMLGMNTTEIFMLLLISLILLFTYKPWRFFPCFRSSRSPSSFKLRDLLRPLLSDDGQTSDLEGACYQNEGLLSEGRDGSKAGLVGSQTLRDPATLAEVQTNEGQNNRSQNLEHDLEKNRLTFLSPRINDQRTWLSLEVTEGPSSGLQHAVRSTDTSKLPVNIGRMVSSSDVLLKDPAVSAKHAQIDWNSTEMKWELVDMGSLNGTLLNSQSVSHPDSGSRMWGNPVELASGDIITLGTTTKVNVGISYQNKFQPPCRIGVASDPMAARRGGRVLPMEDVCQYNWPLPGNDKFGVFCVFDGHGGVGAAQAASKIIPEVLASILSDPVRKEKVLSERDASDVLRDVLAETEALLDQLYEGCTATVLLVWKDNEDNLFAQCANIGDSGCVINLGGRYIQMTENHRVASLNERKRFKDAGLPLRDEDTRIYGINLARMLGDKFPKQQDRRFIAEPYISEALRIDKSSTKDVFAVLASDGLWDVVSPERTVQLVHQMREEERGMENSAEKIAKGLLIEARDRRTMDNTSIIYLDFDTSL